MSQSKSLVLAYGNSAGWDFQALRAVFQLCDMASIDPTIICDERMAEVISLNRAYKLVTVPNRAAVSDEMMQSVALECGESLVELLRFSQVANLLQSRFNIPAGPCGRPFPIRSAYLNPLRGQKVSYFEQLNAIAGEVKESFGDSFNAVFVVVCYDKPRSDSALTESEQYLEGRRQSLLIDDIALVCADLQKKALSKNRGLFPVFLSFQYGDIDLESARAEEASSRQGCPYGIKFLKFLDLNNGFSQQVAALSAIKDRAMVHGLPSLSFGNASTYLHLIGTVGYFDHSVVALHAYPIADALKDDRRYWLELNDLIGGYHVYQQETPGEWGAVFSACSEKLSALLALEGGCI
ncbi:MAG: hypothetical protein SFV17_03360 [Candidatus Obscuribacter sp.]|nr:hypothetical protein [Candidatus Obscuribacter sp.]